MSSSKIDPADLARSDLDGVHLVDVRTGFEFARGHLHGSTNVPFLRSFDDGRPESVTISLFGVRARVAAGILRRRGVPVSTLAGGVRGWERVGLPVEKGRDETYRRRPDPVGLPVDEGAAAYRTVFEGVLGLPFTDGNNVTPLRNGEEIFPAMFDAIDGARYSIDFLTYVYWGGDAAAEFGLRLCHAADRGVRVRVLLDAFGAKKMPGDLVDDLRDAGATVEWYQAVTWRLWNLDNRTHRKILVVDGQVGFTGGVGIAEEWDGTGDSAGDWRDTHFRIEGPAVKGLEGAFIANWTENGNPLVGVGDRHLPVDKSGDAAVQVVRSSARRSTSDVDAVFRLAIRSAARRINLSTAYLNPGGRLIRMLVDAADRGVEVSVVLPGRHIDKAVSALVASRSYGSLLEGGVRIHCYQAAMYHVKALTVDGELAVVGSPNLNARSLRKDDEIALVVLDRDLVAALDGDFADDVAGSEELDADRWRRRGLARRALERAAGLVRREA